jgi:hypothetical protein
MSKSEGKATPGPWRIAPASHYVGSEINIDAGENGTGGYICSPGQRDDAEAVANALIIAAAPDMLAALRRASSFIIANGFDAKDQALLNEVSSAIAKAEGRTSPAS